MRYGYRMRVAWFPPGPYAGTIHWYRGTRVSTRFMSLFGLPLVPLEGVLHLPDPEVGFLRRPFPRSARSIAAAYLRTWPFLFVAVSVGASWGNSGWIRDVEAGGAVILGCAVAVVIGWALGFGVGAQHKRRIDGLLRGETRI
jgi:hypothetical protein